MMHNNAELCPDVTLLEDASHRLGIQVVELAMQRTCDVGSKRISTKCIAGS